MMKVKRCTKCGFTYVEEVIKCPACNILLLDDEIQEKPDFVKKDEYDGKLVTLINHKHIADNVIFKIVKLKNGYICLGYSTPKLIKNLGNISLSSKEKLDEMFSNKEMKFTKL